MDWLTCIRDAIDYIEENLQNDISIQKISNHLKESPFILQHGFSTMTNCSIGEYIRNRRLYLAALDLKKTDDKIIDIAARYRYENPDSFTRAFTRFHGCSPNKAREGADIKCYNPFRVSISIQGGSQIDYKIITKSSFTLIGFQRVISYENVYEEIPRFWREMCQRYSRIIYFGEEPQNAIEKAIMDNQIGEYGVCIGDVNEEEFRYLIAGKYRNGEVPDGMETYKLPKSTWAVFDCVGRVPNSIQETSIKIYDDWLPNNKKVEPNGKIEIEWYDNLVYVNNPDFHSQIWIPIKDK